MWDHDHSNSSEDSSLAPTIRSWKNRIRVHRENLDDLVLKSIDEVFVDLLGTHVRESFYDFLERNQRIAREELPQHLGEFLEALEKAFGTGGDTIAKTIARRLYAKLGLDFTPTSNYNLLNYVESAKSRLEQEAAGARPRISPATIDVKIVAAVVSAVVFTAFYAFAQSWGSGFVVVADILFIIVSGVCTFVAFLPAREWKGRGRLGVVHLGLFLAILSWFLGELVWGAYELLLGVAVPYPSLADIFYLAGYLPALIGIAFFLIGVKVAIRSFVFQTALLSGLVLIGSSIVFLIDPIIASNSSNLEKVFDVAYPGLDIILLVLAATMLVAFADGAIGASWFWISFGMILTTIADLAFSFGTL